MTWFCVALLSYSLFSVSGYTNADGAYPYQGMTASGRYADATTLSCGPSYSFGTRFLLPDGTLRVCWDRGGAISDNRLDLWFSDVADAWAWGRREQRVGVVREGCRE